LHFYLNNYDYDEINAASWIDRSTHHYQKDVSRWRDYGIYCEANHSDNLAVSYFEKGFRAMRIKDGGWLTRLEHALPPASVSPTIMPFWVNPDQGYVTGSLLAYSGFLHDQMVAGRTETEKQDWARRVQTHAGRAEKRYPNWPWVSLWLCEALLVLDEPAEAENVIETARAKFKAMDISEPNLDRVHGHVLLLVNQPARAEPMIRSATEKFPDDGVCWADLGLVEVMTGNRAAAREAFDRALELDPSLAVAWYNRGLLHSQAGQFEEALEDVQQAAILRPDDPEIAGLRTQLLSRIQTDKRR
jgi:tetratricopeptide (TPR) repeat protein